ncbi:MAG TPA: sigma-70 family RNA polymerase sigma factor [Planctomycetota bacterium]
METRSTLPLESLLQHAPRLRALARSLVRDEHAVEDLVQETWVRAVERGPAGSPWGWLARVLRNEAVQQRRSGSARAARERAAALPEATGDEHRRFGLQKELMEAIEELQEPYRRAILLRYFDGLPPRRIATRLGLPVKTVKTRLARGLELLRAILDRRHGSRESWLGALLPLARASSWLMPSPGVVAAALSGAAVLASAGLYLAWPAASPAVPVPVVAAVTPGVAPSALGLELSGRRRSESPSSARAAAPARAESAPGAALAVGAGLRRGRVLDPEGAPVAGLWVGFTQGELPAVLSDAAGVFELPDLDLRVASRDPRYATVLASELESAHAQPTDERIVVVAPAVILGGIVRDPAGGPLAGVGVRLSIPLRFRGRFREVLDHSLEVEHEAETDDQGRFRIEGAPGLACAELVAWSGHARGPGVAVPTHDELGLELTLTLEGPPAPGPEALHLVGEVRHADGTYAAAAFVALGEHSTRTDPEGLFELFVPAASPPEQVVTLADGRQMTFGSSGGSAGSPRRLVAVATGSQPACWTPARDANGAESWPPFVTLWLGGEPERIAGTVLGTDRAPLAGARVWVEDLDFLCKGAEGFFTLEHLMAGKSDHWSERWHHTTSDDAGRFELGSLGARPYRIAALDPATLQVVRAGPFAAGASGVELAFPADALFPRLAGQVLDSRGTPLGGLEVQLECRTFVVTGARSEWYGTEMLAPVWTDEEGRFELARVPRAGVTLRIGCLPAVHLRSEEITEPLALRVVQPWLRHVQVLLGVDAPGTGSIEFRDADERPLEFLVRGAGRTWRFGRIDLAGGPLLEGDQTPVLNVPEAACTAVRLDAQGNEVQRLALALGDELVRLAF